ncbi:GNAT family N-acetyltransferase [Paenibacillus puldeungensis]|uniref:GNAT family N-acetyltransferase n=1 Tax=Paenibacillus puldeungensis TaxID=696536 RepID=A0ABW3S1H0_9BACL
MKSILTSERLILKELGAEDADAVLLFLQRNQSFLEQWEKIKEPEYYTLSYQQALLEEESKNIRNGHLCTWWIFRADDPERVIGSIALSNIVRGVFLSCHLGYRMDQDERNNGYMTEAVRTVANFAFHELGLHRIEANIMPRNEASFRVVEKCGFYQEGLALKYLFINGIWEDHIHMVLRNEAME